MGLWANVWHYSARCYSLLTTCSVAPIACKRNLCNDSVWTGQVSALRIAQHRFALQRPRVMHCNRTGCTLDRVCRRMKFQYYWPELRARARFAWFISIPAIPLANNTCQKNKNLSVRMLLNNSINVYSKLHLEIINLFEETSNTTTNRLAQLYASAIANPLHSRGARLVFCLFFVSH